MTDQELVDEVVERLTEWHLVTHGGYPQPGRWFGDVFVYASTQGDTTKYDEIVAYRRSDLVAWAYRAMEYFDEPEYEGQSWVDCLWEVDEPSDLEGILLETGVRPG